MKTYFFLLLALLAAELCCAKLFPTESHFRRVKYLERSDTEDVNTTGFEEQFVLQRLNHFDPTSSRIWWQRRFVSKEYYKPGGPVFLMMDTMPMTPQWLNQGAWIDYAKRFGAMCIYVEHRYYGKSQPTKDVSTHHLRYLNTEQALADAALLITEFNALYHLPKDVKWIAIGAGYSGTLAAWLRLKYPHLVHGAVASSALFKPEPFFEDYYEIMEKSYRNYSTECVGELKDAFAELTELMLDEDVDTPMNINEMFNICREGSVVYSFSNKDVGSLKKVLAFVLAYVPYGFLQNDTRAATCHIMANQTIGTPLKRLANIVHSFFEGTCMPYELYTFEIEDLRQIEWNSPDVAVGERQYMYQHCTELGLFPVSSRLFGKMSFDENFYLQFCADIFGPQYRNVLFSGIENALVTYGGMDMDVSNVVFVEGSVDPWKSAGIMRNISSQAPAIVIQGVSFAADMISDYPGEPPQVKAAKEQIVTYIGKWLKG